MNTFVSLFNELADAIDIAFIESDVNGCVLTVNVVNPFANVSDNSCVDLLEGCMHETALNYCDSCNVNDGSCIYPILGCTQDGSLNYNGLANTDDGSCIEIVSGCTQPSAFNYDSNANLNDGSCITSLQVIINPQSEEDLNNFDNIYQ